MEDSKITEYCPYCNSEQEIDINGGKCNGCGRFLKPCCLCNNDVVNCQKCENDKTGNYMKKAINNLIRNKEEE